jgi:hypothetical protein
LRFNKKIIVKVLTIADSYSTHGDSSDTSESESKVSSNSSTWAR